MKFYNIIFLSGFLLFGSISQSWWVNVLEVDDLIKKHPEIEYFKHHDEYTVEFIPSEFYMGDQYHSYKGTLLKTFVLKVPNGKVVSTYGSVIIDRDYVREILWKDQWNHLDLINVTPDSVPYKILGKVAVIAQVLYGNYYHWISEVLARLAMIEMLGVEYDFVYAPLEKPYMKETLELWGIDTARVIQPVGTTYYIQADQLIVPSNVSNLTYNFIPFSCYPRADLMKYVRDKLLNSALTKKIERPLSKRVFISRKDAPQRRVINEDEVFALFEKYGFKRYELSKLSVTEQIHLFHNAEIVVSPQGTGLANSMFCNPETLVVELLHRMNDTTICYLSQIFGIQYRCFKTTDFETGWYSAFYTDACMPIDVIKNIITKLGL